MLPFITGDPAGQLNSFKWVSCFEHQCQLMCPQWRWATSPRPPSPTARSLRVSQGSISAAPYITFRKLPLKPTVIFRITNVWCSLFYGDEMMQNDSRMRNVPHECVWFSGGWVLPFSKMSRAKTEKQGLFLLTQTLNLFISRYLCFACCDFHRISPTINSMACGCAQTFINELESHTLTISSSVPSKPFPQLDLWSSQYGWLMLNLLLVKHCIWFLPFQALFKPNSFAAIHYFTHWLFYLQSCAG